jgi:transposase InsO family protein
MSRKGDCWDNAVAESFFHSLKTELVHHCDFEGGSHEAHNYSTQRMRAAFLVQKDSLEIGRLFRARSLNGLGGLWDAWCDGGRRCARKRRHSANDYKSPADYEMSLKAA